VKRWTGQEGVRSVPLSFVRRGAFVESGVILMPSFVNIGARVGAGTMVDTWATVGSCAQIGKNVHLSGGVGIGGVLEPLQGARSSSVIMPLWVLVALLLKVSRLVMVPFSALV
jgi:2,3,4,5-tetrahydropyridine-2-carboxylate N-succinyltransferase